MFVIVPEPFSTDHKMVPFCTVAEKGIFSPPPSQNDVAEFILSICGFKILSKASTWSMFADVYQRPHTPPKAERNYFIDDIQQLIDNPKELKDILAKLPPPQKAL